MSKTILLYTDAHVRANTKLDHFDALGNFIVEHNPDYVINCGDSADLSMLYTPPAKKMPVSVYDAVAHDVVKELRNHALSVAAVREPLNAYNDRRRTLKKRTAKTQFIHVYGNHENRIFRFVEKFQTRLSEFKKSSPSRYLATTEMDTLFGLSEWDIRIPFGQVLDLEGILFSHYFRSGTNPTSVPSTIANVVHQSSVCGHWHEAKLDMSHTYTGRPLFTCTAPSFCDTTPDYYNGLAPRSFKGFLMLHEVDGSGYYEPNIIGVDRLKREYL